MSWSVGERDRFNGVEDSECDEAEFQLEKAPRVRWASRAGPIFTVSGIKSCRKLKRASDFTTAAKENDERHGILGDY